MVVRGMKKRVVGGTVLGVVLLATSLGLFYLVPLLNPEFEWGVDVGDELLFEIKISKYETWEDWVIYDSSEGDWIPLGIYPEDNGTQFIAVIRNLPTLNGIADSSQLRIVIESVKVECRYNNGSAHSASDSVLNSIVSYFLLPTGGWSSIQFFFPIEGYNPYRTGIMKIGCILYDSYFFMGIASMVVDYTIDTRANISLSNGVPSSVTWEYEHNEEHVLFDLILLSQS
jgi:hypothetical protein